MTGIGDLEYIAKLEARLAALREKAQAVVDDTTTERHEDGCATVDEGLINALREELEKKGE